MRETVKVRSDFPSFFPPPAPKNDGDLIFHRCPVSPSLYGYLTHQRGLAWTKRRHGRNYQPPGIVPRNGNETETVASPNEGRGLRLIARCLSCSLNEGSWSKEKVEEIFDLFDLIDSSSKNYLRSLFHPFLIFNTVLYNIKRGFVSRFVFLTSQGPRLAVAGTTVHVCSNLSPLRSSRWKREGSVQY